MLLKLQGRLWSLELQLVDGPDLFLVVVIARLRNCDLPEDVHVPDARLGEGLRNSYWIA